MLQRVTSHVFFSESQALSDSDADAPEPPAKACKHNHPKVDSLVSILKLSDSECEEGEPEEIDFDIKDPCTACGEPFLRDVPRDQALRMAEVFSGSGVLAEEMSALGFVTRSIDFATGGDKHDTSQWEKVAHLLWSFFLSWLRVIYLFFAARTST